MYLYIYIYPQKQIPTLKTFRHKPSSVITFQVHTAHI